MFEARIYGYDLVSKNNFPGARRSSGNANWFVDSEPEFEVTSTHVAPARLPDRTVVIQHGHSHTRFEFPEGITVTASPDGDWHSLCPAPYVPADAFCYLVGPVMPYMRMLQGYRSLHAAVLKTPSNQTMAFCGTNGSGKSTLAAVAIKSGWDLISDDVLMMNEDRVPKSGPNHMRIWPDDRVGWSQDLTLLTPNWEKCYLASAVGQATELSAVILLGEAPGVMVTPVSGSEAAARVASESYLWRFMTPERRKVDFEFWAGMANELGVFAGAYPRTLGGAEAFLNVLVHKEEARNV